MDLEFVLESFQCNISQEQAWAIFHQAAKTLYYIILRFEDDEQAHELSLSKPRNFSDIVISSDGRISPKTWLNSSSRSDLVNKSDDRRILNELLNSMLARLTTVIYQALEWKPKMEKCDNDDEELDLDNLLENLMVVILQCIDVNKNVVDEGYIDVHEDNYIAFVNDQCTFHFECLCRSNTNNFILTFLKQKFGSKLNTDMYYSSILKMMVEDSIKLNRKLGDYKFHKIDYQPSLSCTYLGDSSSEPEYIKSLRDSWINVMSELRFGVNLKPVSRRPTGERVQKPKSELAQLMSQIKNVKRENLRSVADKQKTRSISFSVTQETPIITQQMIVEKLRNLKPACQRLITAPTPTPLCLHERLMNEIRSPSTQLRPTVTIVKPCIEKLYLAEREFSSPLSSNTDSSNYLKKENSLPVCRCFLDWREAHNSCPHLRSSSQNKRKYLADSRPHYRSLNFNKSFESIEDDDDDYIEKSDNESHTNHTSIVPFPKRSNVKNKKKRTNVSFIDLASKESDDSTTSTTTESNLSTAASQQPTTQSVEQEYNSNLAQFNRQLKHSISYSSLYIPQNQKTISCKNCLPTTNCTCTTRTNLLDLRSSTLLRRSFMRKPIKQNQSDAPLYTLLTPPPSTSNNRISRQNSFRSSLTNLFSNIIGKGTQKSSSKIKEE